MRAREERKLVTVLFADLVGSTGYAGDRDPERVRVHLERFYEAMRQEIERTGGTVEKFAGDAVMAVFGAPAALEDHAERALHAALSMQRRMPGLFGGALELRVGVNTGEVVVGAAREGGSFVTGDVVNVADRLQKAAEPGGVLAGERTVGAAEGAFEFAPPTNVTAKGKEHGVRASAVLRAVRTARPRGVAQLPRVFVGRESELELLQATFRRVVANAEPHLVTIVGEPGVGKSRLVRELGAVLSAADPPPLARTGRCLAYGDGITYWPLGEVVREHYGLREGTSPDDIVRRLEGREILGLALGLDVAGELHPLDARERLHAAAVAFVEELAMERSCVLLVEDVHWAEPDLLDLLERLVSDVRAPLLVLASARPDLFDLRPAWGAGRRNATALWLDPLSEPVASQMLEEILPDVLPDDLVTQLVGRAEGNPFFLEELLADLVDSGVLVRETTGWQLAERDPGFSIPDSVHAVLAARIDRLPPLEKAALQSGAVVGRVFWERPVLHLLGGGEPDFRLLEERDLIISRRESRLADDREFVVKHALTREVAYGSIPKAQRGRLHASLADWLERSELGGDERASFLAYHYAQAVGTEVSDLAWGDDPAELDRLRGRAVHWLSRAGELARSRYEMDEAVELLTHAVELAGDEHERALLWREIGFAQALRYDGEAFWAAMQRSLEGPLDDAERAETYAQLAFQTSIRSGMWAIRPKREQVEDWAHRALELAAPGSDAEARSLLALTEADPGSASDELLRSVTELATVAHEPDVRSFALGARCHAAFERGRFAESADWAEQRLVIAPAIDDPDSVCEVYEDGVPMATTMGRFDEARRLAALHWDVARRLSAHHRLHSVSLRLEIADAVGDWQAIVDETDEVMDAIDANLATPCVRNARDLLLSALAHLCVGAHDRSRELERDALTLAGQGHERELNPIRLRIALLRHDVESVRAGLGIPLLRTFVWGPAVFGTLLDALAALRVRDRIEREAPPLAEAGTITEPFALRALGIVRHDEHLLKHADERFAELGLEWHRAQTDALLAGL